VNAAGSGLASLRESAFGVVKKISLAELGCLNLVLLHIIQRKDGDRSIDFRCSQQLRLLWQYDTAVGSSAETTMNCYSDIFLETRFIQPDQRSSTPCA